MKRGIAALFIPVLFLTLIPTRHSIGQIVHNMYDTLCSGDALYGYHTTGIYRDTFPTAAGDSIRVLNLTVIPRTGVPPAARWFNTGTNGTGGTLPVGSTDLRWQVSEQTINGPYAPAIVMTPHLIYSSSIWPDCAWISHSISGAHSGITYYFYQIGFELPCFDSCYNSFDADSIFCLAFDILVDNSVYEVFINGIPQSPYLGGVIPVSGPFGHVGFTTANMLSLQLCNGWKRGHNSLVVQVASAGPNAGFLAQASLIQPPPPPPPPVTASFDMAPADTGCAPHTVHFLNTTPVATGYIWDFGDGSPPDTTVSPVHTYSDPGTYQVTLIATIEACGFRSDTIYKTITVFAYPDVNLGPDIVSCDDHVLLQPETSYPSATYLWNTGAATASYQAAGSGVFWLDVDDHGCVTRDSIEVTFIKVQVDLGGDRDVCAGEQVLLDATDNTGSRYIWNTGDTTAGITATSPGLYQVTVISPEGCAGSDSVLLSYASLPVVSLGNDTSVCEGTVLELMVQHEHIDSLLWSDGSMRDKLEIRSGGAYTVTGINKCGQASDTIQVHHRFCDIMLPNVFTPDGDGINDILRPLGTLGRIGSFDFRIFNRWGELIFYTKDPYQGWDGLHKGNPAMTGTYVYVLEYSIADKPYRLQGNVHLLR